jgi:hypothetical protein
LGKQHNGEAWDTRGYVIFGDLIADSGVKFEDLGELDPNDVTSAKREKDVIVVDRWNPRSDRREVEQGLKAVR